MTPTNDLSNKTTHELNTDPEVFDVVASGAKTHEIRRNDRNFKVGDTLILRKTRYIWAQMHMRDLPLEYTGDECKRTVSHVLSGYGLNDGWVILSFASAVSFETIENNTSTLSRITDYLVECYGDPARAKLCSAAIIAALRELASIIEIGEKQK